MRINLYAKKLFDNGHTFLESIEVPHERTTDITVKIAHYKDVHRVFHRVASPTLEATDGIPVFLEE